MGAVAFITKRPVAPSINYILDDDCTGTFGDNWIDHSNSGPAVYIDSKLRLNGGGSASSGGNALTQLSMPTEGRWVVEFDWYPLDGASWFDDDMSDAECEVAFCHPSPNYYPTSWVYNRVERSSGWSPYRKLAYSLRSSKSNLTNFYTKYDGGAFPFTHLVYHRITLEVDWDLYRMKMFDELDGEIYDEAFSSAMLSEFDTNLWKVNFHWHNYSSGGYQYFTNIKIGQYI